MQSNSGISHDAAAIRYYLEQRGRWTVANIRHAIAWPEQAVLVGFRNHTLVLLPQEKNKYPAVAFLADDDANHGEPRALIQHFLSAYAWAEQGTISIEAWSGGSLPYRFSRPKSPVSNRGQFQIAYLPDPAAADARRALALYREGLALDHTVYAFLSFYKIIYLLARTESDQIGWLTENLPHVSTRSARARVTQLTAAGEDVPAYLLASGRSAVAHAGIDATGDPDQFDEKRRLDADLPVMKNLAEIAIERHYGVRMPGTISSGYDKGLSGFAAVLDLPFIENMQAKGFEFRRRIPQLPALSIRLRERALYAPLENLSVKATKAVDGVVVLDCRSTSGCVAFSFALDFPNQAIQLDPFAFRFDDNGSIGAADDAAEVQRFMAEFCRNGELGIWHADTCLAQRGPYVPININLGVTLARFRSQEAQFRALAERRKAAA